MKIYCCHAISGRTADEVVAYYENISKTLTGYGYHVLTPMHTKTRDILRTEARFKAADYRHPISTNHAIFERDRWMVKQADVVYANLIGTTSASIGTVMELAWASLWNRHTVVAMEVDNVHRHAFVLEAADILYDNADDAVNYLRLLNQDLHSAS